ncbi:MAG: adenosylcobinamide-GDP ribazoletransferase [Chromatiaceae bacterium]|nr:adenosylcobinamide-GDP ribazoletransferase [Chromatiaceae bacterium]
MWRAFLIAGRFLTRLPFPDPGSVSGRDLGRSVAFYPLAGLVIGLLIWGLARLLVGFGFPDLDLAAALVLVGWVWLTGGLHLDGLADTADAWVGGLGDRSRTLEIMKDPRSGPFAVMALVLVLLCKWTAIAALITADAATALILVPVLARAQLLILFLTTPYARPDGMGAEIGANLQPAAAWVGLGLTLVASVLLLGSKTLGLVSAAGIVLLLWRWSMMVRLGGFSGDTAGALVELSEAVLLAAAVLFASV